MDGFLRHAFLWSTSLVPPSDIFEPLRREQAAYALLDNAWNLSGGSPAEFYRWMETALIQERHPAAFFGSGLWHPEPGDLDIMSFSAGAGPLHLRKPPFVHVLGLRQDSWDIPAVWGSFFLDGMLFVSEPPPSALELIEKGRAYALDGPFMEGIGGCMVWAAYKALKSGRNFDSGEWERVGGLTLAIKHTWTDFSNMQTVVYTPAEVNSQLMKQMRDLEPEQVRILTKAALKRLRIRKEKHGELGDRFAHALKKFRV